MPTLHRKLMMIVGILSVLLAAPTLAHHGFRTYSEEEIVLEGTVESFFFGNPHPRLRLNVDGDAWDVWLAAYPRVVYVCFDANVLSVGDTIRAIGHRIESPRRLEMKTTKVEHNGNLYDFYPSDNPDSGPNANARRQREGPCVYPQ